MIKVYHNPRCRKSREAIQYLEEKELDFEIVKYLETPFTEESLKNVLAILNLKPSEILRKTEKIWKETYKSKNPSEDEILKAFLEEPKLIERPIVINKNKGVVARPFNLIDDII
jgi:arsenate reductase (glutaredoxin)